MRIAVISDIHANLHALAAVLAALDAESPDAIWNLGDTVGYGPRPNECCALARELAQLSLVGNHDLAVLGARGVTVQDFNAEAAAAAAWTEQTLLPEARTFLESLSPSASRDGVELYHGSPRDPVWEYVLTLEAAAASFQVTDAPIVLIGHSHVPLAVRVEDGDLEGGLAREGAEADLSAGRWLLNPGSVGQPRDGDPRAAYCLVDLDARRATFRRVPYAIATTQAEMRNEGLPPALADRLSIGA